jgi:hypothetical protein
MKMDEMRSVTAEMLRCCFLVFFHTRYDYLTVEGYSSVPQCYLTNELTIEKLYQLKACLARSKKICKPVIALHVPPKRPPVWAQVEELTTGAAESTLST